jgi:hypothetical protein
MTFLSRSLFRLAIGAVGAIVVAAAYTEAHRAPDQP